MNFVVPRFFSSFFFSSSVSFSLFFFPIFISSSPSPSPSYSSSSSSSPPPPSSSSSSAFSSIHLFISSSFTCSLDFVVLANKTHWGHLEDHYCRVATKIQEVPTKRPLVEPVDKQDEQDDVPQPRYRLLQASQHLNFELAFFFFYGLHVCRSLCRANPNILCLRSICPKWSVAAKVEDTREERRRRNEGEEEEGEGSEAEDEEEEQEKKKQ